MLQLDGQLLRLVLVGIVVVVVIIIIIIIIIIIAIQILLMLTRHVKCLTVDIYRYRDTALVYEVTVGRRKCSLLCRH